MAEERGPAPSTAAVMGHPIHPMLVPLPIAFLSATALTDLAFAVTRDGFWARASRWLLLAGIVSGVTAAVFGLTDFLTVRRARRPEGWLHAGGNMTVLGLALLALALRRDDPEDGVVPGGMALSSLIATLLLVTGWFGGELSYRHQVGVVRTARKGR